MHPNIRHTRTRPLIVKLHGDHRLSPLNLARETEALTGDMEQSVRTLLHERGLIFAGYGGNDESISRLLGSLPPEALKLGVYWVSGSEPTGILRRWLDEREAVWVEHRDFDELMLLVHDTFDLDHPRRERFDRVFDNYMRTYESLTEAITAQPQPGPESAALQDAVRAADESLPDALSIAIRAQRFHKSRPDDVEILYRTGLERYPDSVPLLGGYAVFLRTIRKDLDRAEIYFQRALTTDPNNAATLGNYAMFLKNDRQDMDGADKCFRRALAAEPENARILGAYANFLERVRQDADGAEAHYRRALAAAPEDARVLGSYALFLETARQDVDGAEAHYRRALAAAPNYVNSLANYARLLLSGYRRQEGLDMLRQAREQNKIVGHSALEVELQFYTYAMDGPDARPEAVRALKQALLQGDRSPGWDFSRIVKAASALDHPDKEWLGCLADVCSDLAPLESLSGWSTWADIPAE